MKQAIQPYLHFDKKCKNAMAFYQEIFGGELELMTIAESPAKDQFPKDLHQEVLHASLYNDQFRMMASDMCGQGELHQGNNVQLSLNCSSKEEINNLFQRLSEGGKVVQELQEPFWGGLFAMLIDKFGVRWMLSLEAE
ncbi:VOC family protein [Cytophagaceae bacterium ABcell3]|nr:VOC family protein [Cytophagaceae bacterium ABcell3]